MAYIEGEQRGQHTLFPTTLDELIPQDHVCRVIEAFVGRLDMAKLGFVRSEPAVTVELPFAALKYRIFVHPRFLLRGRVGAQTEISLATLVYNLKRMLNILGGIQLRSALAC